VLAQTTIASLGLLVLLIGIGSELALTAAVLYFVAHALYKAGLFLVVGIIDHATGTREITALGGLRDPLTTTFIAAALLGASAVGLPPLIGYFAKEEMYRSVVTGSPESIAVVIAMIVGNALVAAAGLAVALKPFMGPFVPGPKEPHEGPIGMLAGPGVFGALGIAAIFATHEIAELMLAPTVSAIGGHPVEPHLAFGLSVTDLVFWLSVLTWVLAGILYWQLDRARSMLRRAVPEGWSFDRLFDALMFSLIRTAGAVTRLLHHGRLELYLVVIFVMLAVAVVAPLWSLGGISLDNLNENLPAYSALTFYEWGALGIASLGVVMVLLARTRLFAILSLGVQGFAVALIYLLFGAPDLSFTQFMVEALSVVILALVMTRLRLDTRDAREFEEFIRDGVLALICGVGVTTLLYAVLSTPFDPRLSEFFNAESVPIAHGHNIVNVILVDFRGLDTLGEITVVMTAGIAILALIRSARRRSEARS
jgi:multicomponent Na+:H+ antiporter subunit A